MAFITPQVQEYHDATNGSPGQCYAIRPDLNQIIGKFPTAHIYSRFYFPDGTLLNTVHDSDLSVTFDIAVAGTLEYSSPYGDLIWGTKDGIQNYTGLAAFDPYTTPWTVVNTWGTAGSGPIVTDGVPQNIPNPISFAVTDISTPPNSGELALFAGGNIAGSVSLLDVDNTGAMAVATIYQVGTNGTVYVTAGPTGTVYFILYPIVIGSSDVIFGKFGENSFENIATWTHTQFNALATQFSQFTSLAWDQTDDNVIAVVITNNSDLTTTQYIVKFDKDDGSIIWKTEIETGPGAADAAMFSRSVIENGTLYWFGYYLNNVGYTNLYTIDTATGTATLHQDTTLGSALSCQNQVSNDRIKGIICQGTWNTAGGTITLLNSTATTRTDCLAAVYFVDDKTTPPDHVVFCPPNLDTE